MQLSMSMLLCPLIIHSNDLFQHTDSYMNSMLPGNTAIFVGGPKIAKGVVNIVIIMLVTK